MAWNLDRQRPCRYVYRLHWLIHSFFFLQEIESWHHSFHDENGIWDKLRSTRTVLHTEVRLIYHVLHNDSNWTCIFFVHLLHRLLYCLKWINSIPNNMHWYIGTVFILLMINCRSWFNQPEFLCFNSFLHCKRVFYPQNLGHCRRAKQEICCLAGSDWQWS